ncbi:MAG TPA: DUF3710 domain-containing protein [Sporichthyaceae bacterium]|nr:DUF3710 domain-containing protein [Sporichthyaceae bacterium]
MVFRRRGKRDEVDLENEEQLAEELEDDFDSDDAADEELAQLGADEDADDPNVPSWPRGTIAERDGGPWDAAAMPEDSGMERVDLGGILVPIVDGMELRAEIADERVVAATLIVERSAIQIQPFAAPRTMGIWNDVREEIAAGIQQGGGEVQVGEGRFGTELVATVPVALPDGTSGFQVARFLGVDGPRWFLRAVITGEGAVDDAARAPLEELFAEIVVVRGEDAMAPRDPIELRLPGEIGDAAAEAVEQQEAEAEEEKPKGMDDFNPFERGPEITEIR